MGLEGDHLAVLFLISNSFNGFGFGLFLFAFGVGSSVVMGTTDGFITCIVLGMVIIGLSIVGCCGAIAKHDKKLNSYATLMVLLTAAEIVHLVVLSKSPSINPNDVGLRAFFITMIFIIVISIVSILLASTMSYHIRHARGVTDIVEKASAKSAGLHPRRLTCVASRVCNPNPKCMKFLGSGVRFLNLTGAFLCMQPMTI